MRGSVSKHPPPKRDESVPPLSLTDVFSYLWPYLLEFKGRVLLAVLALLAAKGATLLMPWALKHIVDGLDKSLQTVLVLPVFLLIFYGILRFGGVFFGELRDAIFSRVTERAMRRIGLRVFKHLHKLELAFHLNRQTGGISRDIERGTNAISFLMRFLMFNILPTLIEIGIVAVIFTVAFSPLYAAITLGAVIVYGAFTVLVTQWRTRFVREANQADSVSNTRAVDSLLNYETVKYFNNDEHEAEVYDRHLENWEAAKLKNRLSLLALNSGQALIIALAMTAMMFLAADGVVSGDLTLGDLTMVNAYMIQLFMPLNFLGFVYREIRRALTDLESMLALLKRPVKIITPPGAKELQLTGGKVVFDAVQFGYRSDRPILKDLSLTLEPGKKLAVVGASGAGKSTIARLLYRFYDLDGGGITIDGQNIAQVSLDSLRRQIGVVPQDTVLFNASVRDNIAYGRPGASEDEIERAIDLAHLRGFIDALPDGDQTRVGERGLKVSGGEKQRIAIARVILKRSPILIFDEATSALDSQAESAILQALKEVARGHTTLVIAHRLSTVVDADCIAVLSEGQVVESGNHTELLAARGHYARLWALQQSSQQRQL
ncbi:ABC transporter ATP-binding protein/permease [Gilvimarinus algae]